MKNISLVSKGSGLVCGENFRHFGFLAGDGSHLKVMMAVATVLKERGHKITIYQLLDNEKSIRDEGFEFSAYGEVLFPKGTSDKQLKSISNLTGYLVLEKVCKIYLEQMKIIFDEVPALLKRDKVDVLVVDAVFPEGGTIAEILGLPFINVNAGLIPHQEIRVPCGWDYFPYDRSLWGCVRNFFSYKRINRIYFTPRLHLINKYRKLHGLTKYLRFEDCYSTIAQITQEIKEFEFPRKKLPVNLHFVGLIENDHRRKSVNFPFEKLDGRPVVFASLGTILNNNYDILKMIAEACNTLPVQLVIGLGGANPKDLPFLEGSPIVVRFAPQRELLKCASVFITHAGLNSTNEALVEGVPMLAIPLSFEQPGIAQRINWNGVGKVLLPSEVNEVSLYNTLKEMFGNSNYLRCAQKFSIIAKKYNGAEAAASIIEEGCII